MDYATEREREKTLNLNQNVISKQTNNEPAWDDDDKNIKKSVVFLLKRKRGGGGGGWWWSWPRQSRKGEGDGDGGRNID